MNRLIAFLLMTLCACGPVAQPTPAPPTLTPIVTVQPTPPPGGYRMRTARPIPVGSVDVTAWLCHDANYWWDVTEYGMTLHEDAVGERLCLGLKTL